MSNMRFLSLVLAFVLVLCGMKAFAGTGPVAEAMQAMEGAHECLSGKLPAAKCGTADEEAADFIRGAKDARAALLTQYASDAKATADIKTLFNQLDTAIANDIAAIQSGDAAAIKKAEQALKSAIIAGHSEFKKASGT